MEFRYTIAPYSNSPILQINQHIGFDDDVYDKDGKLIIRGDGQGIDGKQFSREIFELDALKPKLITVYHNSMGGDVENGFDMFNAIVSAKAKTESIISGFSYSTDGWVALGADVVKIYDYSTWMCHLPFDPSDSSAKSVFLNMIANSIAIIISEKSGRNGYAKKTVDEVKAMMLSKTYYTAQDMYDNGLADEVLPSGNGIKSLNLLSDAKIVYREQQKVLNKYIQDTFNFNTMTKIANRLKIATDASEDQIVSAIDTIEEGYKASNKQLVVSNKELQDKLEASNKLLNDTQEENKKRMEEMQNTVKVANDNLAAANVLLKTEQDKQVAINKENEDLKASNLEVEKKAKEATDAALALSAKNLIRKFADLGKISDEEKNIQNWEKRAIQDYEGTELLLGDLPTNVHMPKLVNKDDIPDTAPVGSFEYFQKINRDKISNYNKQRTEALAKSENK